jgi:hypothetical protein
VAVEHNYGVVVKSLEHLFSQSLETRHEADLLTVIEVLSNRFRQHDGWHVSQNASAYYFTH